MDQKFGRVLSYRRDRGFGFIGGQDGFNYFYHINDVQDQFIIVGSTVVFEPFEDPRTNKIKAINIIIVESD